MLRFSSNNRQLTWRILTFGPTLFSSIRSQGKQTLWNALYVAVRVTSEDEELVPPTFTTIATFQRGCTSIAAGEKYVAAGGDDFKIVVKNHTGNLSEIHAEFELPCPVSSLALEPLDEEYLVASGSNGILYVFSLEEKKEVQQLSDLQNNLQKCNSHAENETYYSALV